MIYIMSWYEKVDFWWFFVERGFSFTFHSGCNFKVKQLTSFITTDTNFSKKLEFWWKSFTKGWFENKYGRSQPSRGASSWRLYPYIPPIVGQYEQIFFRCVASLGSILSVTEWVSDKDDSDYNELRLSGITKISGIQRIPGITGIGIQRILGILRKSGIPMISQEYQVYQGYHGYKGNQGYKGN